MSPTTPETKAKRLQKVLNHPNADNQEECPDCEGSGYVTGLGSPGETFICSHSKRRERKT